MKKVYDQIFGSKAGRSISKSPATEGWERVCIEHLSRDSNLRVRTLPLFLHSKTKKGHRVSLNTGFRWSWNTVALHPVVYSLCLYIIGHASIQTFKKAFTLSLRLY